MRALVQNNTLANAGPFVISLCELDAELAMGICLTRDDLLQREFLGLVILREERDKIRAERARYDAAIAARNAGGPPGSFD